MEGHNSEQLTQSLLKFLKENNVDKKCRDQSYDIASNMSGMHSGLQARVKELNGLQTTWRALHIHSIWLGNVLLNSVRKRRVSLTW